MFNSVVTAIYFNIYSLIIVKKNCQNQVIIHPIIEEMNDWLR